MKNLGANADFAPKQANDLCVAVTQLEEMIKT